MKTGKLLGTLFISIAIVGCVGARSGDDESIDEMEGSEPAQDTASLINRAENPLVLNRGDIVNVALKQCAIYGTCSNGTPYQATLGNFDSCPSYARSYANTLCAPAGVKTFTCVCQ